MLLELSSHPTQNAFGDYNGGEKGRREFLQDDSRLGLWSND